MTPAEMALIHAAAFTQSRPWSEQEIRDLLSSPLTFATTAPHGFALIRVIADEAELLTIAVHPDHQRKGMSRTLMANWQAEATTRGATSAFLEVAADNTPARMLYDLCGYRPTGTRRGYYARKDGPAVDAIVMSRDLR